MDEKWAKCLPQSPFEGLVMWASEGLKMLSVTADNRWKRSKCYKQRRNGGLTGVGRRCTVTRQSVEANVQRHKLFDTPAAASHGDSSSVALAFVLVNTLCR